MGGMGLQYIEVARDIVVVIRLEDIYIYVCVWNFSSGNLKIVESEDGQRSRGNGQRRCSEEPV